MKKVFYIIFILSFIPYAFILGYGLYSAIFGYDVYTLILPTYVETIYGLDAFLETVTISGLTLIYFPVIPICAAYEVIYIIVKLINFIRKKSISADK